MTLSEETSRNRPEGRTKRCSRSRPPARSVKAIGHLLPDCFYEQGAALLRILWETTLNVAWVTRRPVERSKLFLQFTVVEKRRFLQFEIGEARRLKRAASIARAEGELKTFDEAFAGILKDYQLSDRRGRRKLSPRISGPSLEDVAREMGGEWAKEYRDTYPLLCFYAHASPGVVIFPNPFLEKITVEAFEEYDQTRTVRLALWSMAVMERAYRMTWPVVGTDDSGYLDALDARVQFRAALTQRHVVSTSRLEPTPHQPRHAAARGSRARR